MTKRDEQSTLGDHLWPLGKMLASGMSPSRSDSKARYILQIPEILDQELHAIAQRRGETPEELIRQGLKMLLLAIKVEEDPEADFLIRDQQGERVVTLI